MTSKIIVCTNPECEMVMEPVSPNVFNIGDSVRCGCCFQVFEVTAGNIFEKE